MRAFFQVLFCLSFVPFLFGCGGGSGGTTPTRTTPLKATIQWMARSRAVDAPSSALSVIFTLAGANANGSDAQFTVNRQAAPAAYTQDYTSPTEIKVGTFPFTARFYANADGQGAIVGTASATVAIAADGTGLGILTTEGTIESVQVEPLTNLLPFRRLTPAFSARDAQNNLVAVSSGSAFFTVTAGGENARIENGELVTIQPGSVTLTVTVDGKTSAPVTGEVLYRGLALDAAWAKERGDAANTGHGKGQRAAGTERWRSALSPFGWQIPPPVITADGRAIHSRHAPPSQVGISIQDMATGQYLGAVTTARTYASYAPALGADGTLYLTAEYPVSQKGLHAVDSTTGVEKWRFDPPEMIFSPPALSPDGRVYVGSAVNFYALDSMTGAEQWRRQIANAVMPAIGTDGTVYVSAEGTLYALATLDGTPRWQYAYGAANSISPVFDAVRNAVYLGDANGIIHAVNAANGERLWQHATGTQAVRALALGTNGKLYAASSGNVIACDTPTGAIAWTFPVESTVNCLSLAADNTVYVIADKLYALDGQGGAKLWELVGTYSGEPATALDGTLFLKGTQLNPQTSLVEEYLLGVQ